MTERFIQFKSRNFAINPNLDKPNKKLQIKQNKY